MKLLAAAVLLLITVGLFLISTSDSVPENSPKSATATIFPIYDIAQNIAGEKIKVHLLVPPGASPHTFELSPKESAAIENSQAVLAVGGIDDWILKSSGGTPIYRLDNGIVLLSSADKDHHQEFDPHYWLNIKNSIQIAANITEKFSQIDPENSTYYQSRLDVYQQELNALDQELITELAILNQPGIATFHSSFNYFSDRYGVEIVATFEEFPGKEPGPHYLSKFADQLESGSVDAVFSEPQLPIDRLKPIAAEYNIPLGVLDPLGGSPGKESYIEMMRYNKMELINTLTKK